MMDKLRQIALFAKVMDHGSFRAAARALNLSPSVVSQQITQLEHSLGVALIYRTTRKLSLTSDGERLLQAAQTMLAAAEAGLADIAQNSADPSGELRVTSPSFLAQTGLVDRIAGFVKRYPKIRLTLDFSETRRELIGEGFDVAIRAGELEDSALIAKKIEVMQRVLVASPSCLSGRTAPEIPDDLTDWNWLILSPVKTVKPRFYKEGAAPVEFTIKSRVHVNDVSALCRLASNGTGLAIVPDTVAKPYLETGTLVKILPEWSLSESAIFAVWPPNAPRHGLTRLFVESLIAR